MQPSLLVKDPDFEYDIQNECTIDVNLPRCAAITRDGKMSPSSQKPSILAAILPGDDVQRSRDARK